MALLNEAVDKKRLDVRVVERNVERGLVTHEELAKSVKNLPDDAENATWVNTETIIDDKPDGPGPFSASTTH